MQEALEYLKKDVSRVEAVIVGVLRSRSRLMDQVGRYLAASKGKRLRPMLALLSARLQGAGQFRESHIRVAAALELVHLATLLHDDVIDAAATRRGKPSVNAKWGNDVAILMADYLFSYAFSIIVDEAGPEFVRPLTAATRKMCEGEMFQIEKRGRLLDVDDYMTIIHAKTACLFSACAEIGALLAGNGQNGAVAAIRSFGLSFGMAFQITDDTLDYTAQGKKWGKGVGTDISNGKQTLPFIHAMRAANPEDRAFLRSRLHNGSADFGKTLECIQRYGSIDHALNTARQYAAAAIASLNGLPATRARAILERLAAYLTHRTY